MENQAVSVKNLRAKYNKEQQLLFKDFSVSIPEGQKVLLLGPSGCGKSTLLQILSGIIPQVVNIPVVTEHIKKPEHWGFVFQDPDTQFCMNYVDEELAFVLENQQVPRPLMEQYMRQALDEVQLELPKLHIPISELSQGMKQRLALACVLLLKPDVVFLDEPSALLDPNGKAYIWQAIRKALPHKTVIVVEHNIEGILDWFHRVIVMNAKGDIIADGHPDIVFTTMKPFLKEQGIWYPNVWEEYWDTQHTNAEYTKMWSPSVQAIQKDNATHDGQEAKQSTETSVSFTPMLKLINATIQRNGFQLSIDSAIAYRGDWIAITGQNGVGKSTLLLSLARMLPLSGSYTIADDVSESGIPSTMSYVFQNPELQFITDELIQEVVHSLQVKEQENLSILEKDSGWSFFNFRQWRKRAEPHETKQKLLECAAVALNQLQLNVPHHRHPYELSLGQKRRLSVLTALLEERSILLLDEPTFGQDARSTFLMLEWLLKLQAAGITIIMITHDEQIVSRFATQIWHIEQGKLRVNNRSPYTGHEEEIDDEQITSLVYS